MKRLYLAAALLAFPVSATCATAAMPTPTYLMKAGAGDQYEVQSSRLVLQSTTNADLKTFAGMMITDHTKSSAAVKAAATAAHLKVSPPKLDAKGAADLAALRRAHGAARDTLYVTQQKAAHEQALALHQGYATGGKVATLRAAAAKIVPVVEMHRDHLASM